MSDQVRQRVEKLRDQHAAKADRLEAASCTVRSMIARRSATNYRDSLFHREFARQLGVILEGGQP